MLKYVPNSHASALFVVAITVDCGQAPPAFTMYEARERTYQAATPNAIVARIPSTLLEKELQDVKGFY